MSDDRTCRDGEDGGLSRRGFLAGTATAAMTTLASGVFLVDGAAAKPADQPVSAKVRWGLLIDVNKCQDGCTACVDACRAEQGWTGHNRPASDPQWIRKVTLKDGRSGRTVALPVMCQHCEKPACVDVCPTGASFKRADGIVLVDRHICIGCRYCMMACPYKARSFVHEDTTGQKPHMPRGKGCVEACTMCVHRVDEDKLPACVEKCATGAIAFGDLNDPNSEISKRIATYATTQIRPDLRLNPGVHYQGL